MHIWSVFVNIFLFYEKLWQQIDAFLIKLMKNEEQVFIPDLYKSHVKLILTCFVQSVFFLVNSNKGI